MLHYDPQKRFLGRATGITVRGLYLCTVADEGPSQQDEDAEAVQRARSFASGDVGVCG